MQPLHGDCCQPRTRCGRFQLPLQAIELRGEREDGDVHSKGVCGMMREWTRVGRKTGVRPGIYNGGQCAAVHDGSRKQIEELDG